MLSGKVRELVDEWETTNVEIMRGLQLSRNTDKATLVKELLGLVTTKSSGSRYLIIGFDDDTHDFYESADPGINQDRLEDILNAYCLEAPKIRYATVPYGDGCNVGLIELFREPEKIPYQVSKDLGGKKGIQEGDIFVRHGSQTEAPTPAELEELNKEGAAARQGL